MPEHEHPSVEAGATAPLKRASSRPGRRSGCTLVAIAKDEGKFIAEWIAYHLSIGVDRICIYVNDSSDSTELIVSKLSRYYPVVMVDWPSLNHKSPQLAAYADALKRFGNTKWMGFWDIDEFIVPYGYKDLPDFLRSVPEGTSAIGINARSFGSSGVTDPDYPSVLHTFRRCSLPEHYANRHIKTLVRPTAVRRMHIHHADMRSGQSVNSGFEPLVLVETGKIAEPVFHGVQINHYQVKTWSEYEARRRKGNANFNPRHTSHVRKLTAKGFQAGDRNELEDESLLPFLQAFDSLHREVARAIEGQLTLRQRLRRIRFMAFNGLDPVVHKARSLRNRLLRKLAHASGRRRR